MKNVTAVILLVLQLGCATIVQSGPDKIPIHSNPEGAEVYLNSMPAGKTPMVLSVDRKEECVIEIKSNGRSIYQEDRSKVFAGWFIGNFVWAPLIFPTIIGTSVDLIAHNQGKHPETPIRVNLDGAPLGQAEASSVHASRDLHH